MTGGRGLEEVSQTHEGGLKQDFFYFNKHPTAI